MKPVIAIHGGAGVIIPGQMSAEKEQAFHHAMRKILEAGYSVLNRNGSALDAVQAAVVVMEDDELFNAGKGAVLTADEICETDAAIMDGHTLRAGAVAGLRTVKNPVILARAVMNHTPHVMLSGEGAEQFARKMGMEHMPPEYFITPFRKEQLMRVKGTDHTMLDHQPDDKKFGTVGAVALDVNGHLAAATSTGGMTNKKWGRVGDSPVIGAGTYADADVAVSCTGHGEYYIKNVVAFRIAAMMKYGGFSLEKAANEIVHELLKGQGAEGGLIAVDASGNIVLPFNTPGMYRGFVDADGNIHTAIYR
ncbi:MAG: isoaspartyl peptidase/L-asparaginase [Bacteroidia bacterium]